MTKTIALAIIAAVALNACARSNHKAPLRRDFTKQQVENKKTKDELVTATEARITGIFGSTDAFKAMASTELSKKLQADMMGISLVLDSSTNEISGEEYMASTMSTARKVDKKCEVKSNQVQAYIKADMISKDNKSSSNLRCLDESCKHVLLFLEERKDKTAVDFAIMAVVLKKGDNNKYAPVKISSDLVSNTMLDTDNGAFGCADVVVTEITSGTQAASQVDIAQIIKQDNERKEADARLQAMEQIATP